MLNETLGIVNDSMLGEDASKRAKLENLRALADEFAKTYSDIVIPTKLSGKIYQAYISGLDVLDELVAGDEAAEKKVADMRKLMDSRRDYYKKLAYLQTDAGQKAHEESKVTQEKVDEAADDEMSNIEMEGLNDFSEISRAYFEKKTAPEKSQFIKDLRKKRSKSAAADAFLRLRDIRNKLDDYIRNVGYAQDKTGKTTSLGKRAGHYLDSIINYAERHASSPEEFLSMADNIIKPREEFVSDSVGNIDNVLFGGNENVAALYDPLIDIVKETMAEFNKTLAGNTPLENLSSSTQ